jgi:hypothetical protein
VTAARSRPRRWCSRSARLRRPSAPWHAPTARRGDAAVGNSNTATIALGYLNRLRSQAVDVQLVDRGTGRPATPAIQWSPSSARLVQPRARSVSYGTGHHLCFLMESL